MPKRKISTSTRLAQKFRQQRTSQFEFAAKDCRDGENVQEDQHADCNVIGISHSPRRISMKYRAQRCRINCFKCALDLRRMGTRRRGYHGGTASLCLWDLRKPAPSQPSGLMLPSTSVRPFGFSERSPPLQLCSFAGLDLKQGGNGPIGVKVAQCAPNMAVFVRKRAGRPGRV